MKLAQERLERAASIKLEDCPAIRLEIRAAEGRGWLLSLCVSGDAPVEISHASVAHLLDIASVLSKRVQRALSRLRIETLQFAVPLSGLIVDGDVPRGLDHELDVVA